MTHLDVLFLKLALYVREKEQYHVLTVMGKGIYWSNPEGKYLQIINS